MILHILPNDKFVLDFIERMDRVFSRDNHVFWIYDDNKYLDKQQMQTLNIKRVFLDANVEKYKKQLCKADRIVLHSMYGNLDYLKWIYNVMKYYGIPFVWIVWGADLYDEYRRNNSIKGFLKIRPRIREAYRVRIIKNLYMVSTACDYDNLCAWYTTKAKHVSAQYSYKLINQDMKQSGEDNEKKTVMVGHSATVTCRHIPTLDMLSRFKGKIKVVCPLSYPNNDKYIDEVIKKGKSLFGGDFRAITDFMEYEEYVGFLNDVDIGVFNNDRQQGMGNILNLIYLGKKVYLSEDNTISKMFCRPKYNVFSINEIEDGFLTLLNKTEIKTNRDNIIDMTSDETFRKEWERVCYE